MQIICFHARLLLSLRPGPRRSLQSTRDIRDSHPVCAASPPPDPSAPRPVPLGYKIAVLVFLENEAGKQLLLLRAKAPNLGAWSPIGGKLETGLGESPFECAVRETKEETGFEIATTDLHLFGMIAEKAYEGQSHWLLFLFTCQRPITGLPPAIDEGRFGYFSREEINTLPLPTSDRTALWPVFDRYRDKFVAIRADCDPARPLELVIEQVTPPEGRNNA
jgi:8-oxo-dGTP diphosphatase